MTLRWWTSSLLALAMFLWGVGAVAYLHDVLEHSGPVGGASDAHATAAAHAHAHAHGCDHGDGAPPPADRPQPNPRSGCEFCATLATLAAPSDLDASPIFCVLPRPIFRAPIQHALPARSHVLRLLPARAPPRDA